MKRYRVIGYGNQGSAQAQNLLLFRRAEWSANTALNFSLVKLSYKPLQGLRGCGAEPHIKKGFSPHQPPKQTTQPFSTSFSQSKHLCAGRADIQKRSFNSFNNSATHASPQPAKTATRTARQLRHFAPRPTTPLPQPPQNQLHSANCTCRKSCMVGCDVLRGVGA